MSLAVNSIIIEGFLTTKTLKMEQIIIKEEVNQYLMTYKFWDMVLLVEHSFDAVLELPKYIKPNDEHIAKKILSDQPHWKTCEVTSLIELKPIPKTHLNKN